MDVVHWEVGCAALGLCGPTGLWLLHDWRVGSVVWCAVWAQCDRTRAVAVLVVLLTGSVCTLTCHVSSHCSAAAAAAAVPFRRCADHEAARLRHLALKKVRCMLRRVMRWHLSSYLGLGGGGGGKQDSFFYKVIFKKHV